jgi:hypothetical protein
VGKFSSFEVPKHCPLILLVKYVREKVKRWKVKKVKRYEVNSERGRGRKLSGGFITLGRHFKRVGRIALG